MNDNFKLLLASDTSLDAQISKKTHDFDKSEFIYILRFLLKLSLVFDSEINVEIYRIVNENSASNTENEND